MMATAAVLVVSYYQRSASTGPFRQEYEGKIVDKWVNIGEARTGSYPARRLLIKNRNGEQFPVAVTESTYGRAQVGMWIKSSKTGGELSWEEPPATEDKPRLP